MAKKLSTCVLVIGLLAATEANASASFANRSLGLGVSGFGVFGADITKMGIDWGVPITLEGAFYIESGFEVFLRVPLLFAWQKFGVTPEGPGIVLASGGQFGVKYMFLEESIRPYVTLHLAGLYFIRDAAQVMLNNFFIGPGTSVGVDFFVGDSISLGARAYLDMYVTLNAPPNFALGGGIAATTYF